MLLINTSYSRQRTLAKDNGVPGSVTIIRSLVTYLTLLILYSSFSTSFLNCLLQTRLCSFKWYCNFRWALDKQSGGREKELIKFIKLSRLRWAGHVMRLNDNDPARKVQGGSNMTGTDCVETSHSLSRSYLNHLVLMSQPGGSKPWGRPKLSWQDQVAEDAARAGCRNWKRTAHDREDWRKLLKEAKAHPGL
jgi:hypothetical protein